MAEDGYRELILAGAATRLAQQRLTPEEFQRLYAQAHRAGLEAAWLVFATALAPKRTMVRIAADHHPSKLAG